MRRIWVIVVALAWVVLPTDSRADTVYLTNGQSLWGSEAYEENDVVVIVRPGGNLRILKSQVSRIERLQTTLPPFYSPPGETAQTEEPFTRSTVPGGGPGRPSVPAPSTAPPGAPRGELSPPQSPGGQLPPPTPGR